jgi:outer membrane protein TolC
MIRRGYRRLVRWGLFGLPFLGLACQSAQRHKEPVLPPAAVAPASAQTDSKIRLTEAPAAPQGRQPLPISLDAVLRLAEEQNPQIATARSKVATAFSEQDLARIRWIPDVYVGVGYFRHQGGIQLQEGPLITSNTGAAQFGTQVNADFSPRDIAFRQLNAARKLLQEQGDLSKITNEQLLDATTTYVDLLAAHSALAVSQSLIKPLTDLLAKAEKAYKEITRPDFELQVVQIKAELRTQQQTQEKMRSVIESATARMNYLLGLDRSTYMVPIDTQMTAFHLVDVSPGVDALVGQALSNGPGIRELENIMGVIQSGMDRARGISRLMPNFNVQVGDGVLGAGPNNLMAWAHRFDLAMQARWNLTDAFQTERKRRVAFAQLNQVAWTYEDLRGKLTMGVADARATILYAGGQFNTAEQQILAAKHALSLSETRLENPGVAQNVTYTEVMTAQKSVASAQLNYIDLMREYDKAQLRMLLLLGPTGAPQEQTLPPAKPGVKDGL